jgi:hypothetical protein
LYLLDALDQQFILGTVGSSEVVSSTFTSLKTVAANFLAQQSATILDYKRVAEGNGMQGAIHCTPFKLQRGLESCLTTWPECADSFQIYSKAPDQLSTLDWVSDVQYQMFPKPFIPFHGNFHVALYKKKLKV